MSNNRINRESSFQDTSQDVEGPITYKFTQYMIDQGEIAYRKLFGTPYQKKNDLLYKQKIAILNYLFWKNAVEMSQPRQTTFLNPPINSKEELLQRLDKLNEVDHHNRMFIIHQLGETYLKIRNTGYIQGSIFGVFTYAFLKNSSLIKRMSISLTVMYVFGLSSLYYSIDRIFDPLYKFYEKDMQEYVKNDDNTNYDAGKPKVDQIDLLIKQAEKKKILSQKQLQ